MYCRTKYITLNNNIISDLYILSPHGRTVDLDSAEYSLARHILKDDIINPLYFSQVLVLLSIDQTLGTKSTDPPNFG